MAKDFDPHRLDVSRFAEEGGRLQGSEPLNRFRRLADESEGTDLARAVRWQARGEMRNAKHVQPEVWLHLEAGTVLPLTCQRCLLPVEVPIAVDRAFRFVPDEATAAAQDEEADEDVLALSRSFDLLELVEDELLLEVPVAPRHEVCPVPVRMSAEDPEFAAAEAEREHPFSALGRLKKH